ncbi:Arm DNA-binding domain-containing protein [Novosphingobium organovorum]|uniref:Arm DNA-binding domain-containing protein n=1 Tax=Novosphingobium organovorum TaxID=2930092 RepID=UPI0038993EF0
MLTDVALKALKPDAKAYKKSDGGGLFIVVHPTGRKSWGLACRTGKKPKFLSGGVYPHVTLREARDWRNAIKAQLTLGMEPTALPNSQIVETSDAPRGIDPTTFAAVALVQRLRQAWRERVTPFSVERCEGAHEGR